MTGRFVLALGLALGTTAALVADVPVPGRHLVDGEHRFVTEAEIPDYAIFLLTREVVEKTPNNLEFTGKYKVRPVELTPKKPFTLTRADVPNFYGHSVDFRIVAVPKDAAKSFAKPDDFHTALTAGKVEGQITAKGDFGVERSVPNRDKRPVICFEHVVERITAKDGFVLKSRELADKTGEKPMSAAPAEPGPLGWVSGVALAAAFATGGLWLTRRRASPSAE